MQAIAGATPEDKRELGQLANELKQAIEARWTDASRRAASAQARARRRVDVTLPGRVRCVSATAIR